MFGSDNPTTEETSVPVPPKKKKKSKKMLPAGTKEAAFLSVLFETGRSAFNAIYVACGLRNPKPRSFRSTLVKAIVASDLFNTSMLPEGWEVIADAELERIAVKKAEDAAKPPVALRARKIRLKLTTEQKKIFESWVNADRAFYNRTVAWIRDNKFKSFGEMRDMLCPKNKLQNDWEKEIPSKVLAGGVKSAVDAYTSNFAKKRENPQHNFTVKFRKKGVAAKSFFAEKVNVRACTEAQTIRIHSQIVQLWKKKEWRHFEDGLFPHDARVICDKIGRWYLCQSYDCVLQPQRLQSIERTVGIDPGVRVFATYYSPGSVGALGVSANRHLEKTRAKLSKTQSKIDRCRCKKRKKKLQRQQNRETERMKNQRNDLHLKSCAFLCKNFDRILLPPFQTKRMASRRSNLNRKTRWQMLTLAHYTFQQRLKSKAEVEGCVLQIVDEGYTTQGCSNCGKRRVVGSADTYRCQHCRVVIDRDMNAARNTFLKHY